MVIHACASHMPSEPPRDTALPRFNPAKGARAPLQPIRVITLNSQTCAYLLIYCVHSSDYMPNSHVSTPGSDTLSIVLKVN